MNDLPGEQNKSGTAKPAEGPPQKPHSLISPQDDRERTPQARKYYRYRKFRKAPIWIEAACAVALVVITGFYTHYAHQQAVAAHDTVEQIIKQYPEIKKSADAAASAATTAQQALADQKNAFVIEQRPYLVVDGSPQFVSTPTPMSQIEADITFKNIGKTPAFRIVENVALVKFYPASQTAAGHEKLKRFLIESFTNLENKNTALIKEISTAPAILDVRQDLAPTATMFTTSHDPVILSEADFKALRTSGVALFYIGIAAYRDSFGNDYETQVCRMYFGNDFRIWHICDTHNTIK